MLLIPRRFVTLLAFAMSIFATLTDVVLRRRASSFQVGSSCWQCPHHFAYTSTSHTPELTCGGAGSKAANAARAPPSAGQSRARRGARRAAHRARAGGRADVPMRRNYGRRAR